MKKVVVIRDTIGRKLSLGVCMVIDEQNAIAFTSQSLERGWLNNARNISCIPAGIYKLHLEWSPKFQQKLWEIYDVPNRRECKFHAANFWRQLNGCIALGKKRADIDNDGFMDITDSRNTMKRFHKALEGETTAVLHIINSQLT
ncbi:DUF5675 family protein [Aquimarina spongiae]|uniref:DUF5675 domain-containing protein n=1 Tax=Aquimarina spongiae TaxID=570521 RepID=A0A1M6B6V3_9FLAO|nr:DUF5675 family protein [Aquimarina spongiae]SHI44484.1 hypothetical protein SAMN04488508_101661 [Aquimarina spongiae]